MFGFQRRLGHFLAAALLAMAQAAAVGEEEPKPKIPKVELGIYDVRWATTPVADFPCPHLSNLGPVASSPFQAVPGQVCLAPGDLAALIKDRLMPQQFADPATSIEESGGKLVVLQQPAVQEALGRLLTELAASSRRRVCVQTLEVAIEPEQALDWLGRAGRTVGKSEIEALLKPDSGATLVSAPQQVLFNGQCGYVLAGRTSNYVHDADVSGMTYDPVVRTLLDGVVMEARPTLDAGEGKALIEFKFRRSSPGQSMPRLPVEALFYDRGSETTKRFEHEKTKEKEGEAKQAQGETKDEGKLVEEKSSTSAAVPGGKHALVVELPRQNARSIRTALRAPVGNWVLAGTLDPLPGAAKGTLESKFVLVFLRCDAVDGQAGAQ